MDQRQVLRILAAVRIAAGTALVVLPGSSGGFWIGEVASDSRVKVMIRAMGMRDLVLGLGTLQALDGPSDEDAGRWARLSAVSDGMDVVASIIGVRRLGLRALPLLASSAGAAILGASAADSLS